MSEEEPNFLQQLMQRKVTRITSFYLVSSFVLLQVADITFEPLGFPEWAMRLLIGALVIGLPIAAALAWIFDLTPQGLVRTNADSIDHARRLNLWRALELVLLVVLLAIVGTMVTSRLDIGAHSQSADEFPMRSVAVVPFNQIGVADHIAAGLTAELSNILAAIPDIQVTSFPVGMTSGLSDHELGNQLRVRHLVKGSLQENGERLRVNAQVVRAADGRILWTYTADHELEDLFTIQDDIANNVASNLRSTLYREALLSHAETRTDNPAAYNEYLLALHHRPAAWGRVREHAMRAVALDPEFVPALTLVADVYLTRVGGSMSFAEANPLAEEYVDKALGLAPNYPPALITKAHLERMAYNYASAERLFRRVKQLAPNSAPKDLANFLQLVGRLDEALVEYRRCLEVDPMDPGFIRQAFFSSGQIHTAIDMTLPATTHPSARVRAIAASGLGVWYTHLGQHNAAEQWVAQTQAELSESDSTYSVGMLAYALARLGRVDQANELILELEQQQQTGYLSPAALFWAYLGVRDLDRAFIALNRAVDENALILLVDLLNSPLLDELRKDLRFIAVLDRLKLNPPSV